MGRPFYFLLLTAFLLGNTGRAQYFSTFNPNDELFVSKVKLIDEFIERFNNDDSTFLKKVYARKPGSQKIGRSQLLVSLFNLDGNTFTDKDTVLKDFFRKVMDREHPVYLSFTDSDWYACADGVFQEDGKTVALPIVLRVRSKGDEWAKWMIAGIGRPVATTEPIQKGVHQRKSGGEGFIATSSYATNFIELRNIFSDQMDPANYFEPELLATEAGRDFVKSVKSGKLEFLYVRKVTFHFYQVGDWVFTVDQFLRKIPNSGWLISSAQKLDAIGKASAKMRLLNR